MITCIYDYIFKTKFIKCMKLHVIIRMKLLVRNYMLVNFHMIGILMKCKVFNNKDNHLAITTHEHWHQVMISMPYRKNYSHTISRAIVN